MYKNAGKSERDELLLIYCFRFSVSENTNFVRQRSGNLRIPILIDTLRSHSRFIPNELRSLKHIFMYNTICSHKMIMAVFSNHNSNELISCRYKSQRSRNCRANFGKVVPRYLVPPSRYKMWLRDGIFSGFSSRNPRHFSSQSREFIFLDPEI